jgi:hypothetical protein
LRTSGLPLTKRRPELRADGSCAFDLNSEIETTDSADFADFEEVSYWGERTNLFVAKLQGIDIRNLLYPCNLRNLRLNPFRFLGLSRVRHKRRQGLWRRRVNLRLNASHYPTRFAVHLGFPACYHRFYKICNQGLVQVGDRRVQLDLFDRIGPLYSDLPLVKLREDSSDDNRPYPT